MTPDNLNPNIFTYQGALQEGELKILAQRKFDGTTFKPLVENGSIESTDVQVTPGEQPDYKWKITAEQAGLYKITLDTETTGLDPDKGDRKAVIMIALLFGKFRIVASTNESRQIR